MRRLGRHHRGSAMVELAFAWPVMALLFFGVLDYSRLMSTYSTVNLAARAAIQRAMNDSSTFALAAVASDQTSWNSLVTKMQSAASHNANGNTITTTIAKAFACPSGTGGEGAHQSTTPSCANYRIYVSATSTTTVSAWAPFAKLVFPSQLAGKALVRVK